MFGKMDERHAQKTVDELKHQAVMVLYRLLRLRMDASARERVSFATPIHRRLNASTPSPITLEPVRRSALVDIHRPYVHVGALPPVTRASSRLLIDRSIVSPPVVKREQCRPSFPHLPQLQFTPGLRSSALSRNRNVAVVNSSKVMRSARLHRARSPVRSISPPYANEPLKSHLASLSPHSRTTTGREVPRLSPLPPPPSVFLPSKDSFVQRETRYRNESCFPSRPLIHSRQRARGGVSRLMMNKEILTSSSLSDSVVYGRMSRRSGRSSTSAAWSPSVSGDLGVRENILISYYTTPTVVRERVPKSIARPKQLLSDFKQNRSTACSAVDERSRSSGHVTLRPQPTLAEEQPQPHEIPEQEPTERRKSPVSSQPSVQSETSKQAPTAADEDCGSNGVTIEPTPAPLGDHPGNKEGAESSCDLADANGESAEKMKGMKQEATTQSIEESPQQTENIQVREKVEENAVHQMGCCGGSPAAIDEDEQLQRPTGEVAAKEAAWLPVNTCVSIVIETVEEEDKAHPEEVDEQFELDNDQSLEQVGEEESVINPEIKLQSILDYVKNRRHEFAKLLEEHAEIVHEINKFEGGVTS